MKIKWYKVETEKTKEYEAIAWVSGYMGGRGNKLLLLEHYTTKAEAVKAVKAVKKSYKGNGEPNYYVRFFDHKNGIVKDYEI